MCQLHKSIFVHNMPGKLSTPFSNIINSVMIFSMSRFWHLMLISEQRNVIKFAMCGINLPNNVSNCNPWWWKFLKNSLFNSLIMNLHLRFDGILIFQFLLNFFLQSLLMFTSIWRNFINFLLNFFLIRFHEKKFD